MADTKISEMTAASALTGTEVVPVLQSSTNKRTTAQGIANLGVTGRASTTVASAGAATLNTPAGKVTSEALIAATSYTLTLTNSTISATSIVTVTATNSANLPVTISTITEGSGSVVIVLGMAALTGTAIVRYHVDN